MALIPTNGIIQQLQTLVSKKYRGIYIQAKMYPTLVEIYITGSTGRKYISTTVTRKEWDAINMVPTTKAYYLPIIAAELNIL